jgi:hypothetical protein
MGSGQAGATKTGPLFGGRFARRERNYNSLRFVTMLPTEPLLTIELFFRKS